MKPGHLLAGLLTIAALLLDVALAQHLRAAPQGTLVLLLGAACGQLALLSVWCVWGGAAWLVRWLAVLAAASLLSVPLAAATPGLWTEWFGVLCLFALLVATSLAVARWSGLDVVRASAEDRACATGQRLHSCQYSLGGLLSLTTATGIACALRCWVAFPWSHAPALASYGMCLTCVAVGSVWAMTSPRAVAVRLAALTLVCLAAGAAMHRTELARDLGFFTLVVCSEAVVICFGLNVRFAGGLRLEWPRETP